MKKNASVDLREGRVFIRSLAKTESGFHIGDGPVLVFSDSDVARIGPALLAALHASRSGVPDPVRGAEPGAELYAAAGVKSLREYSKGAKSVSAHWEDGRITLIPWRNEGVHDGFVPLTGRDLEIADTSPELGAAVIAALSNAE
jgi:hypothetical protein